MVPTPTFPPANIPNNDPPDVKDGVVPVKDKAALLPDRVNPVNAGLDEVAISWIVLTAPDETVKFVELKLATPLTAVVASIPAKVKVPPKDTGEHETDNPVPAVVETVMEEFSNSELLILPLGNITDPPETYNPACRTVPELTVNDDPRPTLPEVFNPAIEVKPVTLSPFNAPKPVIDAPTPTLPVVVRVESCELPETNNDELNTPAEVTVNEVPIPTLPDTDRDDPIPTKPVKNPVPCTFKL